MDSMVSVLSEIFDAPWMIRPLRYFLLLPLSACSASISSPSVKVFFVFFLTATVAGCGPFPFFQRPVGPSRIISPALRSRSMLDFFPPPVDPSYRSPTGLYPLSKQPKQPEKRWCLILELAPPPPPPPFPVVRRSFDQPRLKVPARVCSPS